MEYSPSENLKILESYKVIYNNSKKKFLGLFK